MSRESFIGCRALLVITALAFYCGYLVADASWQQECIERGFGRRDADGKFEFFLVDVKVEENDG